MMSVEDLLDRYEQPTHRGRLPVPPALAATATNPRCGDVVTMFVLVQDDRLTQVTFEGGGCTLSQAGADIAAELAEGQSVAPDITTLLSRIGQTSRVECAALGLRALQQALNASQ
jgi:nitrogen fixation NifU-like protein